MLKERGIRVIRFTDHEVLRDPDAIARTILRVLTEGW
jgi:very-short-patch-repair endonuclease